MKVVIIRNAKHKELPRIVYVTKLAYKIPYKKNSLVTKNHEPADLKNSFLKNDFFVKVALINNKIIGAVRYNRRKGGRLYLYKLAVLKSYRSKGVATRLIYEVELAGRKLGCGKILLDCAREKKLTPYYKKLGFKVDLIKKHLDHHDVYMSKKI